MLQKKCIYKNKWNSKWDGDGWLEIKFNICEVKILFIYSIGT